jgi:hypothetical protein
MTIYYLYVMTHRNTGLKYLGFTTQDINKYNGSGKYWKRHVAMHGINIDKEIIHECHSKEELKRMGIYYSELWNIVYATNEHGKKIWANEKMEEGAGGGDYFRNNNPMKNAAIAKSRSGDNHPMKDPIRRANQSRRVSGPNSQLHTKDALRKKSGDNHYLKNQPASKNPVYDHTLYRFENIITGEIIEKTAYEFCLLTGGGRGNVSQLVHKKKRPKTVMGWRLVD